MASVALPVLVSGTPALVRGSERRSGKESTAAFKEARGTGLRSGGNDRFALKSAFYSGGQAVAFPGIDGSGGRISMRVTSPGAYICRDCGYIYNDRKPFDKLPADYYCPVCAAPKRRFKPYDVPVARNANEKSVRKARKADLQSSNGTGQALPIGIAIGALALVIVYWYTNTAF